jgi:hypothetical protein
VHVPVAHKLWPRLCQSVKYLLVGLHRTQSLTCVCRGGCLIG